MPSVTSASSESFSDFPVRRFTVDEYRRLGESGILGREDRVELLEGYIVPKMIHNPPHDVTVSLVDEALRARVPNGWHTRIQSAITTDDSQPEPDVVVVRGDIRDYSTRHPSGGDIDLVVEVAESSLERDRRKCRLYARAGIAHYWIVNLPERRVETFRDPSPDLDMPAYRESTVFGARDSMPLTLFGRDLGRIDVSALLP